MSESISDESLDEVQVEYDMLVSECQELLWQLDEIKNQKPDLDLSNFQGELEKLMKEKKYVEDQISDVELDIRKKQMQMETYSLQVAQVKDQLRQTTKLTNEKEELVKLMSKQLKEM